MTWLALLFPLLVAPPTCPFGLAVNVPVGGGVKELTDAILTERKMGLNLMQTSVKWSDLEPTPEHINVQKLQSDLGGQIAIGFLPFITIQTIDTNQRTVPADLANEPWDSPKMAAREAALLHEIAGALPSKIGGIMLGNEVDGYLIAHPSELDGFVKFLSKGRTTLHEERPGIAVGVTTMFLNLDEHRDLVSRLQDGMDLVSMTYYPIAPDFSVAPPSQVGNHFDQMAGFAGTRKLFIQEAGYPASELLGSSEAKQAAFVDALFDAATAHQYQLAGVCYFLLVDFNDAMLKGLVGYYGLQSDRFQAMLGTLGLKKQDGTPRAAWAEFQKRAIS